MAKNWLTVLLCVIGMGAMAQKPVPVEFRGVWIATVSNIDWPKKSTQLPRQQQADFIEILDFYAQLNFNTIIVQVRTAGDAFYESDIVPWSRFLTGTEGDSMRWEQDPMQFMIEETHKRGMEFHAWLNPYRATYGLDTTILHSQHIFHEHPSWMIKYGKNYYLDPGKPRVWNYLGEVVKELVSKYDVDGIHFDDYFYPYKIPNQRFDDRETFMRYGIWNHEDHHDWRRANVDSLVKTVSEVIKKEKPWVSFGISPFGVWRNKADDPRGSETQALQTTYDDLYANPIKWMEKEWVDYLVPQLYWSLDYAQVPYRKLAEWWSAQTDKTPVYLGIGAYKVQNSTDSAWWDLQEIPRQIQLSRNIDNIGGSVFFSAKSLMKKPGLAQQLKKRIFNDKTLPLLTQHNTSAVPVPATSRLRVVKDTLFVDAKNLSGVKGSALLVLDMKAPATPKLLAVFRPGHNGAIPLAGVEKRIALAIKDPYHRMGLPSQTVRIYPSRGKWKKSRK